MNFLVVGGNGFIGSYVIDSLLADGHAVTAFDRSPMRADVGWSSTSAFRFIQGNLQDATALRPALQGADCVLHMASSSVPASAAKDPVGDIEQNLVGSVRVLEAMVACGVRRIVYLSSGGTVYGITSAATIAEDHTCAPVSSYGIVKRAVESYLDAFARSHGLSTLVLRPSNPYGPRQGGSGLQGLVAAAIRHTRDGTALEIWGEGSVVRDYIYITDLVELIVAVAVSDKVGIFNAGTGRGASVIEVIDTLRRVSGRPLELVRKPAPAGDVPRVVLDCQKAMRDFNWAPSTSLEQGIRRTWEANA